MKIVNIIPRISIVILAAGCGGNSNTNIGSKNADTVQQNHETQHHKQDEEAAGKLNLNHGDKWQANAETTQGIRLMQTMVSDYLNKSETDNKKLSLNLDKEFNTILEKCTMKGAAHEQLHNYLLPLKQKIDRLNKDTTRDEVKAIQTYLNDYDHYFK